MYERGQVSHVKSTEVRQGTASAQASGLASGLASGCAGYGSAQRAGDLFTALDTNGDGVLSSLPSQSNRFFVFQFGLSVCM